VNPKDTSTIAEFKGASEADVDHAVSLAQKAFESGPWAKMTGEQRGVILNKFAQLLLDHAPAIAYCESICSGRPLAQCNRRWLLQDSKARAARCLRWNFGVERFSSLYGLEKRTCSRVWKYGPPQAVRKVSSGYSLRRIPNQRGRIPTWSIPNSTR